MMLQPVVSSSSSLYSFVFTIVLFGWLVVGLWCEAFPTTRGTTPIMAFVGRVDPSWSSSQKRLHPVRRRPYNDWSSSLRVSSRPPEEKLRPTADQISNATWQELNRIESPAVRDFALQEAPSWLLTDLPQPSLPFSCTECGRCCFRSTDRGAVYLSQPEIQQAADWLTNGDDVAFVRQYASHTLRKPISGEQWIRLQKKPMKNPFVRESETAATTATGIANLTCCIFYDEDTKHCQIYPARPLQCSIYPFYPNLLESMETWNAECRRGDLDTDSTLPLWDPLEGTGCEGMTPIREPPKEKDHVSSVTPDKNQDANATTTTDGVPLHRVYEMLYEMQQLEQAMYRNETNDKDTVV